MSIDQERYETYKSEVEEYIQSLSPAERQEAVKAKLLDWLARTDVDAKDQLAIQRKTREFFDDAFDGDDPEWSDINDELAERYEQTTETVNRLYDDVGDHISREMQQVRAIEQANEAALGEYRESTIQEIRTEIQNGLAAGDDVDALRDRIAPISSKASFYAETIAKTHVKSFGRAVKAEKARLGNVPTFEYVGIIRSTTRPFCRELVDTTHHIDDIRKMRNNNREPVLIHCGGWNCIHDWEPDPFNEAKPTDEMTTVDAGTQRITVPKTS